MKYFVYITICLFIIMSFSMVNAEPIGTTDKDVTAIADPIMDNILKSMDKNDYKSYSKDFSATMKKEMTKEKFVQINKQMSQAVGKYKSRTYVGFKTQENMTAVFWKGTFDKYKDGLNITLVLSKVDDKYFVEGLWFTK